MGSGGCLGRRCAALPAPSPGARRDTQPRATPETPSGHDARAHARSARRWRPRLGLETARHPRLGLEPARRTPLEQMHAPPAPAKAGRKTAAATSGARGACVVTRTFPRWPPHWRGRCDRARLADARRPSHGGHASVPLQRGRWRPQPRPAPLRSSVRARSARRTDADQPAIRERGRADLACLGEEPARGRLRAATPPHRLRQRWPAPRAAATEESERTPSLSSDGMRRSGQLRLSLDHSSPDRHLEGSFQLRTQCGLRGSRCRLAASPLRGRPRGLPGALPVHAEDSPPGRQGASTGHPG